MTYNLTVWFVDTYGNWGYITQDFVMPKGVPYRYFETLVVEQEKKIEELSK